MPGAGEVVPGRRTTRSVTRALSNVKQMDKCHSRKSGCASSDSNICADMTVAEGAEMHGATSSKDPFVNLSNMEMELEEGEKEEGTQDPLSSSESDQLFKTFLEWADRLKKRYTGEEETKKRFLIWCSTKKRMDERHSHKPGYVSTDLNLFADMTESEIVKFCGKTTYSSDPFKGRNPVLELWKTKEGLKEVAKGKKEFKKWLAVHKRNYGSTMELEKRFLAFLYNKRKLDAYNEVRGKETAGYNFEGMDKMFWERRLI